MNNPINNKLAIIIPAFKSDFFKETLESIANQTCKSFTLYIGDDASACNIEEIAKLFENKIKIQYRRFEENVGRDNLIKQWERCIDMIGDEEWIWIFSDDDIMDTACVERFYQFIDENPKEILVHYDVEVIGRSGLSIKKTKRFPTNLSSAEFFEKKIRWQIESFIVDFIFKRTAFELEGGFEYFDLAWCSDDATWIKLSKELPIRTITNAMIKWRLSDINISSIVNNESIVLRKACANIKYLKWSEKYFKENQVTENTSTFEKARWALIGVIQSPAFSISRKYTLILSLTKTLNYKRITLGLLIFCTYCKLKTPFTKAKNRFASRYN